MSKSRNSSDSYLYVNMRWQKSTNREVAKAKMVYGIVIACILIAVGLFVYFNYPFSPSKPEIDMRQKIEEELPNGYSIYEYDWIVWSKTARDSGLVLTKMDTWEQFEESYKQTPYVFVMMLDEKNRVVWFKPYVNHAIYYEY